MSFAEGTANHKVVVARGVENLPPHAPESERSAVAIAMYLGEVPDAAKDPYADDFYVLEYRVAWRTIKRLEKFDLALLIGELRCSPELPENRAERTGFNWAAFAAELNEQKSHYSVMPLHVDAIKKAADKRSVLDWLTNTRRDVLTRDAVDESHIREEMDVVFGGLRASRNGAGKAVCLRADRIPPRKIHWLFDGQIPLAKYSTIVGHPGIGKSLVTIDLAARVSCGLGAPGAISGTTEPGDVVMIQNEDDYDDTTIPRLIAAGADLRRITFLTGVSAPGPSGIRPFTLEDIPVLEQALDSLQNPRLVTIDPVGQYCGRADSHRDNEVRALLMPLVSLAQRRGAAIVGVAHFNKGNGKATDRGMGSVAWIAVARMAWGVAKDPEDNSNRLFLPIKCNLAKDTTGLSYRIIDGDVNSAPRVAWSAAPESRTMDDVLADQQSARKSPKVNEAVEWLSELLGAGRVPATEVWAAARANGHNERAVNAAKQSLKVSPYLEGFGKGGVWYWQLPENQEADT
jgi:hypothetical protein